jgi:hypothetical protein
MLWSFSGNPLRDALFDALKTKNIQYLSGVLENAGEMDWTGLSWSLSSKRDEQDKEYLALEINGEKPQAFAEALLDYLVFKCQDRAALLRYMLEGGVPDIDTSSEEAIEEYRVFLQNKGYDLDGFYDAIYGEGLFGTYVSINEKDQKVKEILPL